MFYQRPLMSSKLCMAVLSVATAYHDDCPLVDANVAWVSVDFELG